jgi:hypothetical protein
MDRLKGTVAGLVGGIAGTFAMSEFQAFWSRAIDGYESDSAGGRHDARDWQERSEDDNANEQTAQMVAVHTIGRTLNDDELSIAAPAVHYAFGSAMGALYGMAVENAPVVRAGSGSAFGAAVWIGADEIAMPMLGLESPDNDRTFELHAQSFASHIVYGVTTELVRRAIRRALG